MRIAPTRTRAAFRLSLIAAIAVLSSLLAFLVLLFLNMQQPPGVTAPGIDDMRWVRSIYGFGPADDEQFHRPYSVAVGPNGRIYATDPARARVMVFLPTGEFADLVHTGAGGEGEGEFVRPEAVDVDGSGNLFIADSQANKVIVFDADGQYLREWSTATQPRGISVSEEYVCVLGVGTVSVFGREGESIREFASRGDASGEIDAYLGIHVHEETIYVADSYNRRIQAFDMEGELLWVHSGSVSAHHGDPGQAEGADPGDTYWSLPQDVTVDASGRLVVVDAFRFEIVVLEPDGTEVIDVYGAYGRQEGRFFYPTSIDYDPVRDWFVVADTSNRRVQIVRIPDSGGNPLSIVRRTVDSPARWMLPTLASLIGVAVATAVHTTGILIRKRQRAS